MAVDKAIDTSRGLEPEDAGALLAATALRLQESDLTAEESRDPQRLLDWVGELRDDPGVFNCVQRKGTIVYVPPRAFPRGRQPGG